MALTATQKADIKEHLGYLYSDDRLDGTFEVIDADPTLLARVTTQLTACGTALTNYQTAKGNADEVTSGFGATLNHNIPISNKWEIYCEAVGLLSTRVGWPIVREDIAGGGYVSQTDFLGGC